jgi:phospholipase C
VANDGGAVEVNEGDPAGAANLEKIDHVVVMMLENRSFDHMLGYLSLSGRRPEINGLRPGLANEYQGRAYPAHHLAATGLNPQWSWRGPGGSLAPLLPRSGGSFLVKPRPRFRYQKGNSLRLKG